MATIRKKEVVLWVSYAISLFISSVIAVRTKNKIYIDLKTQSACFRNLNATHQAGCTSATKGNVGTVHYVESPADFGWILSEGPHAPYVALLNSEDFNGTTVRALYESSRVTGIMVINILENSTGFVSNYPAEGFSSVDSCPNDQYGMYSKTPFKNCNKFQWNPPGTSLHFQDISIPIFALSDPDDVDAVLNKCFYPFNNQSRGYPVCAAELKARMDAAVDAVTCIRRSDRFALSLSGTQRYCDSLGDQNVIVTMKNVAQNESRENKSVILIGARLDSTSLFQNEYRAADTTVAGIVTLLATAQALWKVRTVIQENSTAKDIMFTFFQGETFDYIGSSRMVYDMNLGKFPQEYDASTTDRYLHNITLEHLDQILELNQVGLRGDGGELWAHVDGLNNESIKVEQMISNLQELGKKWNVTFNRTEPGQPLPPASAQRFLRDLPSIPTVVVADHQNSYTNKFYNSRFDTGNLISATDYPQGMNESEKYNYITRQAELISNLSTTLALYLYKESMGSPPPEELVHNMTADALTVTNLLYCFLVSPNCEMFIESVDETNLDSLQKSKQPFSFYVSVNTHTNEVTQLVKNILARFTGDLLPNSHEDCTVPDIDQRYSYVWMQGKLVVDKSGKSHREGWCVKSLVHYTEAVSPAFKIDGYDMMSGEYSTWTESRWGTSAIGVRLFLLPSEQFQINVLAVGLLMFMVSLAAVYVIQSRSSIIFQSPQDRPGLSYNPMT
ncbi:hypothetical protein BsWGS_16824 [Bradybaena similaris]